VTRYAIVPTHGRYGSGERVHALSVHGALVKAEGRARRATRQFQAAMRAHGGTSAGYRVVETDATTRRDAVWLGHELDRTPSVDR
jgi:hypothetical protein